MFCLSGSYYGSLYAWETTDFELLWNKPAIVSPPFRYYTTIYASPLRIYSAFYDGHYEVYNTLGIPLQSKQLANDMYVEKFMYFEPWLIAAQKKRTGMQRSIAVYYDQSTLLAHEMLVDFSVAAFVPYDAKRFFILCNGPLSGRILLFDTEGMDFWEPHSLPAGQVYDACAATNHEIAIGCDAGIFRYIYSSNSLLGFSGTNAARHLTFSRVSDAIFAVHGKSLFAEYAWPGGQLLRSVNLGDSIMGIYPVYNK
jgi:hypothetical protein